MKKHIWATLFLFINFIGIAIAQSNYIAGQLIGTTPGVGQINSTSACDTVFSFPGIDPWLSGITYDGTYLWSGGYNLNYIYKHDLTGAVIDSVPHPFPDGVTDNGGDLEFDGTNIWFLQEDTDTLYKMDPANGNVISRFKISTCTSNCYGVAFDGTYIWISDYLPSFIYKVDPSNGVVLNAVPLATSSFILPIKFINGKLYGLGLFPGMINEIDTANGNILNSIPWCLGYSLGFCVADNHMWGSSSQTSTGGTQRIYKFDSLLLSSYDISNPFIAIDIYPNPSSGDVQVKFEEEVMKGNIEVSGVLGQIILKNEFESVTEIKIDLSGSAPGVYFIKVFDEQNYTVRKLILGN